MNKNGKIQKKQCQNRKWYRSMKVWIIVIIAFSAIFLVPRFIDCLYLVGSDKVNTTFESKDLLSFWGELLGGSATLIGVMITVRYSDRKFKEQQRLADEARKRQIRPDLTSAYKHVYQDDFVKPCDENDDVFNGFVIIKPKINELYYMPDQPTWLKYKESQNPVTNIILTLQSMKKYLCAEYKITNTGNDTACNIKIRINGISVPTNFVLEKTKSKILKLIFILEDFTAGEEKSIEFMYSFYNVDNSVEYHKRECITVFKNKDETLSSKQQSQDFLKTI